MKDYSFEDIDLGDQATFSRSFNEGEVRDFGRLSGDMNPLHLDETYARTTQFRRRIVHGMLVGSLCSTLVGMYIPGKRCLYLSQTFNFRKPVYIGDELVVNGIVKSKSVSTRIIEVEISIKKGATTVLDGTAKVKVL